MFRPIRMLLQPLLALLLLSSASATTSTCKRLTDSDSPFISGLSVIMGPDGSLGGDVMGHPPALDPRVFAAIDQSLPALSQCVAETSPLDLLASLMASPDAKQCWQDLSQLGRIRSSSSNSGSTSSTSGDADGMLSTSFRDDVCPAVKTIAPCLTDVLVPAIERVMANARGGCCDPLTAQITAAFGRPTLRATVASMVSVLGNAFCSERVHVSSTSAVETCGDSLVNNWVSVEPRGTEAATAMWTVLDGFQIPNDQVCRAVGSERFNTTVDHPQRFGAPGLTPYGACYAPMDELLQYVRGLPLWTRRDDGTAVDELFGDDTCMAGEQFVAWAGDESGPLLQSMRIADDIVDTFAMLLGGGSAMDGSNSNSGEGQGDDCSSSSSGSGNSEDEQEPSVFDTMGDMEGQEPVGTRGRRLQTAGNFVMTTRSLVQQIDFLADDMCIHFPNGVTCDFPEDTLETPFPPVTASSGSSDE